MENISEGRSWINICIPEITPPSLKNNIADTDRLIKGIKKNIDSENVSVDLSLIKKLPHLLRQYNYAVKAGGYEDEGIWNLIDVFPSDQDDRFYGLAVDLGSTTVVGRLIDLNKKSIVDEMHFNNPQIAIGSDILTRIHYANSKEGGLEELQNLVMGAINRELLKITEKHAISSRYIVGMTIAGNTAMTHFFLGLTPYWICREPYIPVINKPPVIRAGEIGLEINRNAPVFVFPNIGSYFGGDLIAGILASQITHEKEPCFLVDVGTNAEVVIGNSEWLMACAGAAGPALEGGVASMGMMAGPGVIDKVKIDPDTLKIDVSTISGDPPVGICGSGLIDLVAQLFLAGMIDIRGKFVPERCGDRLVEQDGIMCLIIVPAEESGTGRPLTLSQPDIDALIRSKGAMYTILTTISNTVGISMNEIKKFFVAGTFGSYINPRSAIILGMLPDIPIEKFVSLGNTSLKGAQMVLLSADAKQETEKIRDQIAYLELNVNQEFMNLFSAAKFIPHTDRALFPSVPIVSTASNT